MTIMPRLSRSLLVALPLLGGCSDLQLDTSIQTALRVMNASPDGPALDIYVQSGSVAKGLAYPLAAPYVFPSAGPHTVEARAANGETALLSFTHDFVTGTSYTIAFAGLAGALEPVVLTDDETPAVTGRFKLRVVHLAALGPAMDFYFTAPDADLATSTPLFGGIVFKEVRGYVTLPTGDGRFRVTEAGNPANLLIDSQTRTFVDGQVSTLFIVGKPGEGGGGAPYAGQFLADGGQF